jgi:hypothetical protein
MLTTATHARRRLAGLAVLVAVLAVPATASAERTVSYRVTVEGEGKYRYDKSTPYAVHRDAHWKWKTEFPIVTFEGDKPHTQSAENMYPTSTATLLSGKASSAAPSSPSQCTANGISGVNSGRFLPPSPIPDPNPTIGLRVLAGVFLDFNGCPGQSGVESGITGTLVNDVHSFDTWFSIPREAIGMGRIIQLLTENVTGNRCPSNRSGDADCQLTFDATVTFDKFYDSGPEGDEGSQDTKDDNTSRKGRLVVRPAAAKLARSAAKAGLLVTCPAACSGTVTATLPRGRAAAAKARPLARTRFRAAAGQTRRVVVRFSRAARRRIRRAGGVSLRVRTVSAGETAGRVVTLRLRR